MQRRQALKHFRNGIYPAKGGRGAGGDVRIPFCFSLPTNELKQPLHQTTCGHAFFEDTLFGLGLTEPQILKTTIHDWSRDPMLPMPRSHDRHGVGVDGEVGKHCLHLLVHQPQLSGFQLLGSLKGIFSGKRQVFQWFSQLLFASLSQSFQKQKPA